jgi:MYXO-CTERM domain-containing protein
VAISNAAGWDDPKYSSSLRMGDIDGDGKADACARGKDGVRCWLGSGTGLGTEVVGPNLTDASGWGDPAYGTTLRLADFDGDGRDDLCALAAKGVACWRSLGTSFGPQVDGPAWSTAAGYSSAKYYGTFRTGDLDGDGRDDVCLRGPAGIECALSDGAGFPKKVSGPELSDASGWGDVSLWSTIRMADVTGDGRADLCARSKLDYQCWASTGFGFDRPVEVAAWSDAAGWNDPSNYRTIRAVDLDGDGAAEICGRGDDGIKCYKPGGTNPISGPAWTDAVGWSLPAYYDTIRAGDVDGDGKADLCARAAAGFRCIPSTGTGFAGEVASTEFSDKSGWDKEPYYPTILFGGPGKARPHPGSRDGGAPGPVADGGSVQDAGIGGGDDGDGCACRTGAPRGSASGGAIVAAVAILLGAARRRRNRV